MAPAMEDNEDASILRTEVVVATKSVRHRVNRGWKASVGDVWHYVCRRNWNILKPIVERAMRLFGGKNSPRLCDSPRPTTVTPPRVSPKRNKEKEDRRECPPTPADLQTVMQREPCKSPAPAFSVRACSSTCDESHPETPDGRRSPPTKADKTCQIKLCGCPLTDDDSKPAPAPLMTTADRKRLALKNRLAYKMTERKC